MKDLGMRLATSKSKTKVRFGLFECPKCEKEFEMNSNDVKRYKTGLCKSCSAKMSSTTHGDRYTRLYKIFMEMRNRCNNPNCKDYTKYGGIGIKVKFVDYLDFKKWSLLNGYTDELTIDRIDNDGNYKPDNCRWTNKEVQAKNKRKLKRNSSGYIGVSFCRQTNKWRVDIMVNYKSVYLGVYKDKLEAVAVREAYIVNNNLEHTKNKKGDN